MVRLHMVHDEVIYGPLAQDFANFLQEKREEICLYRVDKRHFFVDYKVRIVRDAVGQEPESFKAMLHAVVYTDVMDIVC